MKTRSAKPKQTNHRRGNSKSKKSGSALSSLQDLFLEELRDLYDAENQLVKALPKIASAVSSPELEEAIKEHLDETRGHVRRLEQVFEHLDETPRAKKCEVMKSLLEEGEKLMKKNGDASVIDAGIISAAQRVEHYEIAGYGCVCTYAKRLGHSEAAALLEETLTEEKQADEKLTEIAESSVNIEAESSTSEAA